MTVAYAQIDWHDFVVVETVDFQPGETGNFPPPTTPQEVGARVVQQERFDRNEPKVVYWLNNLLEVVCWLNNSFGKYNVNVVTSYEFIIMICHVTKLLKNHINISFVASYLKVLRYIFI